MPVSPPIQFCKTRRKGGQFSFLLGKGGWKFYIGNRPQWEATEEGALYSLSLQGKEPAVWFWSEGLGRGGGRGLQQDEQACESRGKSIRLFPEGWKVAPAERCWRWVGTSCKVLECQVPEDPGGGRLKPLFSLTIGLQLVGKLEEEVLVVDDLELAHVGLGLQVMGGRLHIQAWGTRRERRLGRQTLFFLSTHTGQRTRMQTGTGAEQGGPGEAKERMEN